MDKKLYINPPLPNRVYDWRKGPQPKTRRELDRFFNSPAINKVKDAICEMDICLVDMSAGQLCGRRPRTSEVKVHIAMMKTAGWNACVHCHPPHCNAFLFAGQVPPNGINPEADIFFNQIPLAPYGTPGTDEVAANVAKMSKKSNVVFMENHGIVCGARDIEEAEWFAENADAYCQVLLLAAGHGGRLQQVGPQSVKDFLAIRKALGLPLAAGQKLYNTDRFNGYRMKRVGK